MTLLQAWILGVVQGATEFFPISSSAHLRLFKYFLGVPDGEHLLYFDLLCHLGTLFALILYLRRDIWRIVTNVRQIGLFTLALLPLIPGYFLLKPLRIALSDPSYLGFFLMATGILLFVSTSSHKPSPKKWKNVLWIGIMQTMALIPGISRSGATIATARLCGWEWLEAARFSFLLAVPTIVGGEILETWKLVQGSSDALRSIPLSSYSAGFVASFGVGLLAVRAVFWIYKKEKVRPMAWYCIGIGLIALALFNG